MLPSRITVAALALLAWTGAARAAAQAPLSVSDVAVSGARPLPGLPVHVAVRAGIASPARDYQSACGHSSFALGAEARTRGPVFATASLDLYRGAMGEDVGCLLGGPGGGVYTHVTGGLRVDGASRLAVGLGRWVRIGPAALEAGLGAGMVRGRPGYARGLAPEHARARWLPWVGGSVRGRLLGTLEVSWERGWTRLPFREETFAWDGTWESGWPASPSPDETPLSVRGYREWERLGSLSIGLRW